MARATKPKQSLKRRHEPVKLELPIELKSVNLNAAGIDIGSKRHFVAVPEGRDKVSVKQFGVFTGDLEEMAEWLYQCGVTTVAMESTGYYWIPVFELLEGKGFEVKLVDARQTKNVSGRKSDMLDCQWQRELHTVGLLKGAFRPPDEVCVMRGYMRQREMLVQASTMHIQHMQKALTHMNLRLGNVVSDITGVTGMKIIKAIIAGERNAQVLASHRTEQCKQSQQTIAKSLRGNYRTEHLFALKQAFELYGIYQEKLSECERELMKVVQQQPHKTEAEPPPADRKLRTRDKVRGAVDVRSELYKQTGVDLYRVPGLGPETLLTLRGEVGIDMTPWKTEKMFSSWLGVCPGTKESGGKVLSRRSKRSRNRAAAAFRIAAASLRNSPTALGAFYRRIRARSGEAKAVTATAHKLAKIYYRLLKFGEAYVEVGEKAYEERYQQQRVKALKKQAAVLGFTLVATALS
jgi:transposase